MKLESQNSAVASVTERKSDWLWWGLKTENENERSSLNQERWNKKIEKDNAE